MSASYKVLAPFVTLKVKDANGQTVVQGYYLDGVVQDPIEDEQFDKHVRNGWLEEADAPASEPEPEQPVTVVEDGPVYERPAGNASQEAWATYALESGQASEDEVKDLSRDELRELYG